MPGLFPSGAIMGVVAYGEVKGSDGTSAAQNSGQYMTARTGVGTYTLTPTTPEDIQTDTLSQCSVQIKNDTGLARASAIATNISVPPTGVFTIVIRNTANQLVDADFSFVVLRSTISPPVGSPA